MRGRGCGDPPARQGRVGLVRVGWTQEKEENPRAFGCEMQATARLEVDCRAESACDGRDGAQPQRLFNGPKGLPVRHRLDDDEPPRIETEVTQTMAVGCAEGLEASPGQDEKAGPAALRHGAAEQHRDEAEGRRHVARLRPRKLVQSARNEPALGQVLVDRR